MKCDRCQNKASCYDGNHELTRHGCADNNWCCFSPITNADRIRAMTDEELAEFLETLCPSYNWTLALNGMTWFDWLKQEAET